MVEILVENPIFTAKVVLNGDSERLDKIDDSLLLNERPRLPPFIAGGIFGDLWSHTCETKVGCVVASWLDTRTWHFFFFKRVRHVEPHDASESSAAKDNRRP